MMPGTRPPFQGDSLGDVFPRAEAHGLFCFRPLGDGKMSKLKQETVTKILAVCITVDLDGFIQPGGFSKNLVPIRL